MAILHTHNKVYMDDDDDDNDDGQHGNEMRKELRPPPTKLRKKERPTFKVSGFRFQL